MDNITFIEHVDEDGTARQAVFINGEQVTRDVCSLDAEDLLLVLNKLGEMYRFNLEVKRTQASDLVEV